MENEANDSGEGVEDVSTVMTEVLNRLERIVEHFRQKGENDAANSIAKNTIASVNIFNDAIAPWDIATMAMQPSRTTRSLNMTTRQNLTSHKQQLSDDQSSRSTTSWAAVAAVAPAAGNKIIKYTPTDTVQMKAKDIQVEPVLAGLPEVDSDKRVVWIRGWATNKCLGDITDKIGQGPVYSMAYSEKDAAVCVIFQYATSAQAIYADDKQYTKQNGHSRFGPGCDVVEGLPFPSNDDMRRMTPPFNERRRLTFARSQLFTQGMNEDRFREDIHAIVGEKNVELVWLFNTGNATVVFSAVPLARLVRNEFIRIAKGRDSPYHGVQISFSHDPCERPMHLITQMPTSRQVRSASTYGRNGALPAGIVTKSGSSSRRNTLHELEGWHTVSRKR